MAKGAFGDPRAFFATPRIKQKSSHVDNRLSVMAFDELPPFSFPSICYTPPKGIYSLKVYENGSLIIQRPLEDKCIVFGSSPSESVHIRDVSDGVNSQHFAVFYANGKFQLLAINGRTEVHSITLFDYIKSDKISLPTISPKKPVLSFSPLDGAKAFTSDKCVVRMPKSNRVYFIEGPHCDTSRRRSRSRERR